MSFLKFIEAEVPKEKLGLLAVPLTPLQIILPLILSKYTNGPRPFDLFIKAIPFRYNFFKKHLINKVFIYFNFMEIRFIFYFYEY